MPGKESTLHEILQLMRHDPTRISELVNILNTQGLVLEGSYHPLDFIHLAQALVEEDSRVDELTLNLMQLDVKILKDLPQILEASPKITSLSIVNATATSMPHLIRVLEANSSITVLHIRRALTLEIVEILVKYFEKNKTLSFLALIENHLTLEDSEKIINSFKSHPTLEGFYFQGRFISFPALSELLKTNTTLVSLALTGPIHTYDLKCLVEGLEANSTLECLKIASQPTCKTDIKILTSYLEKNPSLICLELNDNKIKNEGAVQLMRALEKNIVLEWLDFSNMYSKKNTANVIDKTTLTILGSFLKDRNRFTSKKMQEALFAYFIPDVLSVIMQYLGKTFSPLGTAPLVSNSQHFLQVSFIPISTRERITHGFSSLLATLNPSPPENGVLVAPPQTVANNTAALPAPSNSAPPSETEEEAKRPAPKFGFHWKVLRKK